MYDVETGLDLLAGKNMAVSVGPEKLVAIDQSIAVKVISLIRSTDRRAAISAQLDMVRGLNWSFYDALESAPDSLRYDAKRSRRAIGRELSAGEIGCFASHVALWRWFIQSPHDILIVLEDDLLIDTQFFSDIRRFCEATSDFDYVRLYAKAPAKAVSIRRLMGRYIVRYRDYVFGTQGYVLRRPAAAKLCKTTNQIVRPIDIEIDRYWAHGVRNIGLTPFPMIEMQVRSTIGDDRLFLAPLGYFERVAWVKNRALEAIRRRSHNFGYYCSDLKKKCSILFRARDRKLIRGKQGS